LHQTWSGAMDQRKKYQAVYTVGWVKYDHSMGNEIGILATSPITLAYHSRTAITESVVRSHSVESSLHRLGLRLRVDPHRVATLVSKHLRMCSKGIARLTSRVAMV
jgi:hypothetical protein